MFSKSFALFGGVLMLVIALWSLIPGQQGPNAALPALKLEASYGLFLGLLPMNILNKMALLVFGTAGLICSHQKTDYFSVQYSKIVFIVFGVLAVAGTFPLTSTLGGYWPLFGSEIIAHGAFALIAGGCAVADTRGSGQKAVHA